MRAYTEATEEAVYARDLLKDWRGEGLLTAEQYARLEQETVCELRRTNVFLRLVLFLFTLLIVGAGVGLFFVSTHLDNQQTAGVIVLFFAGLSYASAEFAVSQMKLYRYGIEEALAVCSVAFLCAGMELAFFGGNFYSPSSHPGEVLVFASGAAASLWIWHRFGLFYAFIAAMIFVAVQPAFWTTSLTARHLIQIACFGAGLVLLVSIRSRYRFTYLNDRYSIAEGLLWLGIYCAINLQLAPWDLGSSWWDGYGGSPAFPKLFYWATWFLTWSLPPVVLARGLRTRDRFVIAVGAVSAVITLITNKPYLGWPRHTWDPMLLGALLAGVALAVRRWLARSPSGIRRGFTAQRLSGKDKNWMNLGGAAIGLAAPEIVAPHPPSGANVTFGGGSSGGGGASSDF